MKAQYEFNVTEWKHAAKMSSQQGRCLICMKQRQDLRLCSDCKERFPKAMHFSDEMWRHRNDQTRKCNKCSQAHCDTEVETRQCTQCQKKLTQTFFSDSQWTKYGAKKRKCYECCTAPTAPNRIGQWTCVRYDCKKTLPKELFSLWSKAKNKQHQNNTQVCNQCFVKDRRTETEQNRKTNQQVQKHRSEAPSKKK